MFSWMPKLFTNFKYLIKKEGFVVYNMDLQIQLVSGMGRLSYGSDCCFYHLQYHVFYQTNFSIPQNSSVVFIQFL